MRLTYSGVTGTLALTLAISTGGAYAANTLLPTNSVTSKAIKNGQVKTKDFARNAVKSRSVAPDALTGADLDESTLGEVPVADRAGSARTAERAGVADRADSAATAERAAVADRADSAAIAERAAVADRADSAAIAERALVAARSDSVVLATVRAAGTLDLARSRGAVNVARPPLMGPSMYLVTFDRDISACVYNVIVTSDGVKSNGLGLNSGFASAAPAGINSAGATKVVAVETRDRQGNASASDFMLTATC